MKCREYTFRRNVSGLVMTTIQVVLDENITTIRGANSGRESLEADLLAAASCIAGNHSRLLHQREYQLPLVASKTFTK